MHSNRPELAEVNATTDDAAERAVAVAVLLYPPCLDGLDFLRPEHFNDARLGAVFARCRSLWEQDREPQGDINRVLGPNGCHAEAMGGALFVAELFADFAASSSARAYGQRILEAWRRRRLVALGRMVSTNAGDAATSSDELMKAASDELLAVAATRPGAWQTPAELVPAMIEEFHAADSGQRPVPGLRLGIGALDAVLGGIEPHALVIVAARPGAGKSSLATDIVRHVVKSGKRAVFFTLEMGSREVMRRMLAVESDVPASAMRDIALDARQLTAMRAAGSEMMDWRVLFDDSGGLSLGELTSRANNARMRHGAVELLVVDYLQLIRVPGRQQLQRHLEVGEVTRSLKELAKRMGAPVLALSQLSRAVEGREGPPRLSDLRESGSIEQDADVVVLLHPKTDDDAAPLPVGWQAFDAIVAKNRNGPCRTVPLFFHRPLMSFTDTDPRNVAQARVVPVGARPGRGGDREDWQHR